MKKRILSFVLLVVFCFTLSIPTLAASPAGSASARYIASIEPSDLSRMSVAELQNLIHLIALQDEASDKLSLPDHAISLAWIAAAELAYDSGYPCAGTVVKASAYGDNYIEENGLIANTIAASDTFAAWKQNRKDSIYFEKSDIPDLFYAIHAAEIHVSGSSSGGHAQLYDKFDFKFETDMGDLFSTLVNDWAWLCQHISALTPIDVWVKVKL